MQAIIGVFLLLRCDRPCKSLRAYRNMQVQVRAPGTKPDEKCPVKSMHAVSREYPYRRTGSPRDGMHAVDSLLYERQLGQPHRSRGGGVSRLVNHLKLLACHRTGSWVVAKPFSGQKGWHRSLVSLELPWVETGHVSPAKDMKHIRA